MLGYTCATKANTKGRYREIYSKAQKNCPSSDCKLELVYMKSESLVIVNHDVTVNDLSNFAHTAHHARRVVTAGNLVNIRANDFAPRLNNLRRDRPISFLVFADQTSSLEM